MVPPMASAPNRHAVQQRASRARNRREIERLRARRRRPERHVARFLLAALLSAVLLLTLLLTAFGTWSAEPVTTKPLATPAVLVDLNGIPELSYINDGAHAVVAEILAADGKTLASVESVSAARR